MLHHLDPRRFFLLANTAGCYTADEAIRYARLGRGDWFVIYQPGPGETLRSIAAHFLGDAERDWAIADFNGVGRAEAGQPLVVPVKSRNPIGVQPDEYQTVPILAYHRFGAGGSKMVVSR